MFDVEKLVNMVGEVLDAEYEKQRYNIKMRNKMGLSASAIIWIPRLDGSTAYHLGELSERALRSHLMLTDVCRIIGVDQDALVSTVKSIRRKEQRDWRWKPSADLTYYAINNNKEKLCRFIQKSNKT